jgi:transcriptional regulator with XRE-family HTH domain
MSVKARQKPKRLAEKLLEIRVRLGLSQNELIRQLGVELAQNRISDYELGIGEPSLPVILCYARLVGLSTDFLIDDELDLPAKLPAKPKHK